MPPAPEEDWFGFYIVEGLLRLLQIYKPEEDAFFKTYFKRRDISLTETTTSAFLKRISLLIKHFVLMKLEGENLADNLNDILRHLDSPLPSKLKRMFAGSPYRALLLQLAQNMGFEDSTLKEELLDIDRKVRLEAKELARFKEAHCTLTDQYTLRFTPFTSADANLPLWEILSGAFNLDELSNFFIEYFSRVLTVPQGMTFERHLQDSMVALKKLFEPCLPLQLLPEGEENKKFFENLVIQAFSHYYTPEWIETVTKSLGDRFIASARYPRESETVKLTLAEIPKVLEPKPRTWAEWFCPSYYTVAARLCETFAYLTPVADTVFDVFYNEPVVDKSLESVFSGLFAIAAALKIYSNLREFSLRDYGEVNLGRSLCSLVKNPYFWLRAIGSLALTGIMYISKDEAMDPSLNTTENNLAIAGIIVGQYLAMATGIHAGVDFLSVFVEYGLRKIEATRNFIRTTAPSRSSTATVALLAAEAGQTNSESTWVFPKPVDNDLVAVAVASSSTTPVISAALAKEKGPTLEQEGPS